MENMVRPIRVMQRTLVPVAVLLCWCGWLAGCGGAAVQPRPEQFGPNSGSGAEEPLQEQLLALAGQATLTDYRTILWAPRTCYPSNTSGLRTCQQKDVRVNGQGEISLPLVGPVKVSGLSTQAIGISWPDFIGKGIFIKQPQNLGDRQGISLPAGDGTGAVKTSGSYEMILGHAPSWRCWGRRGLVRDVRGYAASDPPRAAAARTEDH